MTEKRTHFSAGSEHPQISFLREAANYFRNRPTHGEDRAFWSNVANADNCEKAANLIERMLDAAQAVSAPVAWRWHFRGERAWTLVHSDPGNIDGAVVEPLYSQSAPVVSAPHNNGERLPNGDAAAAGADTQCSAGNGDADDWEIFDYARQALLKKGADAKTAEMGGLQAVIIAARDVMPTEPQTAPQPTLVIGPNTTGGDENFAPASGLNYSAARLLLWFKSWDEAVQFNASLTRPLSQCDDATSQHPSQPWGSENG